jgi:uracil phosphoribosyltransferase
MSIHVLDHPLAKHLLTILRDEKTMPEKFRRTTRTLSMLLALEATKDLRLMNVEVQTPVAKAKGFELADALAVIPVLRAGLGMLDPILELFPRVDVGYVGLERHEETAIANSYYLKLPPLEGKVAICLDPMLATGGSASQAIALIKRHRPARVLMVSIVSAPEGVQKLADDHPDVEVFTAAIDDCLNDRKYIVPGVGDYGDRLFGT